MEVVKRPKDIFSITKGLQRSGKTIGLVPTMGALHQGHFSIIESAKAANDVVIVSIFVNPLQFNREEDLKSYPKTIESDTTGLQNLGVDILYLPELSSMYEDRPEVSIAFGRMAEVMEGHFRPGHFSGVGVVVAKLFNQTNPENAYFGLKDLQQFLLIKTMVKDLSFGVNIIGFPTVREPSGLALSSRNQRLSEEGLNVAANIYQGLILAESLWKDKLSLAQIKPKLLEFYQEIDGLEVEYLSIVNPENLQEIDTNNSQDVAFCVAGYVEGVRLIDNLYLRQD